MECPTSSQLTSLHKTITTSLFGTQSNEHRYQAYVTPQFVILRYILLPTCSVHMTVHPAVESDSDS